MTYTLYYSPGAASMAVHWMLVEARIPCEARLVDIDTGAQHSAEYLRLNPAGRVPTLVVDGVPRHECTALLMLLAERHPDVGLAPPPGSPDRAEWLELMVFFANTVLPAMRDWFYADSDGDPSGAQAVQALATRRIEGAWDRPACRRPTLPRRRKTQHRRFSRGDAHALDAQHASQGNEPGEPYAVHQPLTRFAVVHRTRCQRRTDRLEQSGELKVSSTSRALYQSCCAEPAVPIL